jgi:hypothetical protein
MMPALLMSPRSRVFRMPRTDEFWWFELADNPDETRPALKG